MSIWSSQQCLEISRLYQYPLGLFCPDLHLYSFFRQNLWNKLVFYYGLEFVCIGIYYLQKLQLSPEFHRWKDFVQCDESHLVINQMVFNINAEFTKLKLKFWSYLTNFNLSNVDWDLIPGSIGSSQHIVWIKLNKSVLARFFTFFGSINSWSNSSEKFPSIKGWWRLKSSEYRI